MPEYTFDSLVEIMKKLRSPGGCPWDAEQSHDSLKRYLIEECYEVIEAIDHKDDELLKEELGDLLLQPVFHAAVAEERGVFTIADIIQAICGKLVRRHPHVFGNQIIATSEQQVENWEKIKKAEKGDKRSSALSGVPPHLPAILKAQKIGEKASRVGFDWDSHQQVLCKIKEELNELEIALDGGNQTRIAEELGDLLFATVNLGRFMSIDSEDALSKTIHRFTTRFSHIEASLRRQGKALQDTAIDELERLWQEAKACEHAVKS
ncbi:nucleoside triphosphate pyrophosphohydrolase [Geobacter pelophilus]|uniref:Nucleoside triphosphate pyrophosphohydrolase n=1 Tax=Geoanaerobacter pelophilus TaxID=60036 RepID=A0AAW4LF32_9BACT|nr:nucleoside triphosphate pyrophosphohydrolase [Geoanaerobacter pelophilus]MBT0666609.1 nucleoside triphosphate pyrophosphohydrolase [Geoanaerobacter pelophilus]